MSRIVHFEIHALDPENIAKFYTAMFGWKIQKWEGPIEYWMVTTGDPGQPGINGGLMRRKGGAPGDDRAVNAYVCTVGVESLDACLAALPGAGGSIALPKQPVPGFGWLPHGKGPDGNIFGMMQPDPGAK